MVKVVFIVIGILCACIVAYFLLIMPRMLNKADSTPFLQVLYAHRGLHNNSQAPENSLEAFQLAVEKGFGIELDVQLTKDLIPVVFHDFTLERMCGVSGHVRDYLYTELQGFPLLSTKERIPKLSDVLLLVDGQVPLIVEYKTESLDLRVCKIADKLLRDYKGDYCIESFNPLVLFWYRRKQKSVMRGQLSDAFLKDTKYRGVLYFILQNLLLNCLGKPDFVAYNHKYPHALSRQICRKIFRNTAAAYTLQSKKALREAEKDFDIFIFDGFLP
ncbi:glycerophosphodiester phosphodiesterase [Lachnospiraceae bacterium OttesenSCG-928-D06]|nr:glycerophosphodiester phosphodiesterase [Lachnospiraceae bacterium OttesenSCG-928-D06]